MFGTDKQKEQFIKPVTQDGTLGCFMLSEPGNGSDAGAASTTAVDQGEHFLINGNYNIDAISITVLNNNSYTHPVMCMYYTILCILSAYIGSKAWITNAHDAAYGLLFATTDKAAKHKGISAFIVDMRTTG